MMNTFDLWKKIIVTLIFASILFMYAYLGYEYTENKFQKEAIEKGFAQFNAQNGNFEWKN